MEWLCRLFLAFKPHLRTDMLYIFVNGFCAASLCGFFLLSLFFFCEEADENVTYLH